MRKKKIAIFVSGVGSNMLSIMETIRSGALSAEVAYVFSNKSSAKALDIAKAMGVKTICIERGELTSESYYELIYQQIKDFEVDLIVLAGFMSIIPESFLKKVAKMVNIHPSLLPDYKGLDTYRRMLENGEKYAGSSVHFVSAELDGGEVVMQVRCRIYDDDTIETLCSRVKSLEHFLYPVAIGVVLDKI